jgi:hypothetical protein
VIAAGATDRESADTLLERYKSSGLPEHGEYPQVVESRTISGLKPGFWIVVAGAPKSESVAKILASHIGKTMPGAYYRPVTVPQPEALRLIIIESTTGSEDDLTWWVALKTSEPRSNLYCIYRTNTCFAADEVSSARVEKATMRVVLPFVGTGTRGDIGADPSLHAASGAACRVSVPGKADGEPFTFDAEITTFKRVQLKCDYPGD